MSTTAARPVASAATHRASPRGVALAAAARPRAARVFPVPCRETRASGGVGGSGVVAPTRAAAEPATLGTDDDDDADDDEHDDEGFSSYGDGDTIVAIATPVVPNAGGVRVLIRLSDLEPWRRPGPCSDPHPAPRAPPRARGAPVVPHGALRRRRRPDLRPKRPAARQRRGRRRGLSGRRRRGARADRRPRSYTAEDVVDDSLPRRQRLRPARALAAHRAICSIHPAAVG